MAKSNSRILIVEDNPDEAKFIQILLSREGYEVALAPNGKVGLEMAASFNPDLIILDVMMPELDGFSASKKLKASDQKNIPIILLTGVAKQIYNSNYPLDGVLRAEVDEYFEKPINPEQFLQAVKKYLS